MRQSRFSQTEIVYAVKQVEIDRTDACIPLSDSVAVTQINSVSARAVVWCSTLGVSFS